MGADRTVPAIDYVAAFLRDAARQDASVWTIVNVIKHFLDDGLTKADALLAATRAEEQATPRDGDLITLYRDGIQNLLAAPVATANTEVTAETPAAAARPPTESA